MTTEHDPNKGPMDLQRLSDEDSKEVEQLSLILMQTITDTGCTPYVAASALAWALGNVAKCYVENCGQDPETIAEALVRQTADSINKWLE